MPRDLSAEETVVIAAYSNRQDAEVAKARLDDQNVSSVVSADDVHPPLPLTEGVELRVLNHGADCAREILETGPDAAPRGSAEVPPDARDDASAGTLTGEWPAGRLSLVPTAPRAGRRCALSSPR